MLPKDALDRRFREVLPGDGLNSGNDLSIYFEQLSMTHLSEIHAYSQDDRFYEFLEYEPFESIDETRGYIKKLLRRMDGDGECKTANYWVVRRKADNRLVGTVGLVNLNPERRSIEWSYGIDPLLWGEGYILEIQQLLKKYVFEILELNRLYGLTMAANKRTISSVLAAGMKHEGVLRQYYCKSGVFVDGWQYSMISKDYFESIDSCQPRAYVQISSQDVIGIVRTALENDLIDQNSTMENTVNWDSFSHMALMVLISQNLKISLSPSEMMQATSVVALEKILRKRMQSE